MLKISLFIFLSSLLISSCNSQESQKRKVSSNSSVSDTISNYEKILRQKENLSIEKNYDSLGTLISQIDFHVRTNNLVDYKNGVIPYIEIGKSEKEISNLIGRNEIVIKETEIEVILDYPLDNPFVGVLRAKEGFTREMLIQEISSRYRAIYEEEERTATIKTIPMDKRTEMYNRNQTDGKYGIWGHDIADLVVADILVYRSLNGRIILVLEMES
jgi:hypothetical protein